LSRFIRYAKRPRDNPPRYAEKFSPFLALCSIIQIGGCCVGDDGVHTERKVVL